MLEPLLSLFTSGNRNSMGFSLNVSQCNLWHNVAVRIFEMIRVKLQSIRVKVRSRMWSFLNLLLVLVIDDSSTILLGGRLLSVSSQFIRLNKSEGDARLVSLQLQVCPACFATKAALMAGAPSFWMVKLARSTALFSGTPCSVNTCTSSLNWSVERVARAFAKVLPTSPGWLRIHLWMVCTSG